jgi:hypothetical protein
MNNMSHAKRAVGAAAVSLMAGGLIAGTAGSAHAANKDGVPNTGELVQWYYPNYGGGCEDDYFADYSSWDDYFKDCGYGTAGVGQRVANNSMSVCNFDSTYTAILWTGVGYTGAAGAVPPNRCGNLNSSYVNNVESLSWRL